MILFDWKRFIVYGYMFLVDVPRLKSNIESISFSASNLPFVFVIAMINLGIEALSIHHVRKRSAFLSVNFTDKSMNELH